MVKDRNLKLGFGIISLGLLVSLLVKLTNVPGGMILSGLFLGGMMLVIIILVCAVLSLFLWWYLKKTSYLTILSIMTTIAFIAFHYQLYSPTLTIRVPNGYTGEINLVLSNVKENILTVDSNGIGYLNEWTFHKTYTKPIVKQLDGKDLDKNLIGFNPSTFFGMRKTPAYGKVIESLSFEIVPDDKIGQKQIYSTDLEASVNKKLVLFSEQDEHAKMQTESILIDSTSK